MYIPLYLVYLKQWLICGGGEGINHFQIRESKIQDEDFEGAPLTVRNIARTS